MMDVLWEAWPAGDLTAESVGGAEKNREGMSCCRDPSAASRQTAPALRSLRLRSGQAG